MEELGLCDTQEEGGFRQRPLKSTAGKTHYTDTRNMDESMDLASVEKDNKIVYDEENIRHLSDMEHVQEFFESL